MYDRRNHPIQADERRPTGHFKKNLVIYNLVGIDIQGKKCSMMSRDSLLIYLLSRKFWWTCDVFLFSIVHDRYFCRFFILLCNLNHQHHSIQKATKWVYNDDS